MHNRKIDPAVATTAASDGRARHDVQSRRVPHRSSGAGSPQRSALIYRMPRGNRAGDDARRLAADTRHRIGPERPDAGAAPAHDEEGASLSGKELDRQLVALVQEGDKHAFNLLVEKYQRRLARVIARVIRERADVEDVTQEAFIKAYRALPSFRGDCAFYTWLYRVGVNTAKNYLIAKRRRAPTFTPIDSDEAEGFADGEELHDINTPESMLFSDEIARTLDAAIEGLPGELRTAIRLREIEMMAYDDIARIMNCPIGTVRSRIFRAREAIAERLRPLLGTGDDKRW